MLSTTLDPTNRLVAEVLEQRWNEKNYFEPGPFNWDFSSSPRVGGSRDRLALNTAPC
jgi:hypothetical protein